MTISIADRRVERIQGVSELGRLALGFVDGGSQWLEWAIGDRGANYHFPDEPSLVQDTQTGLHGARLLFLPGLGLWISAAKMMTIPIAGLRSLVRAEGRQPATPMPASARQTLDDHGIASAADLAAAARDIIGALGVPGSALFQGASQSDSFALAGLLRRSDSGEPAPVDAAAAEFAARNARSVSEFADYYRAWIAFDGSAAEAADSAAPSAEAVVDTLRPLLFPALDCPRLDGAASASGVAAAIAEWLIMGRQIGFPRISAGIQQVIANAGLRTDDPAAGKAIVNNYLAGAQALLSSAELKDQGVAQDGTKSFRATSRDKEAIVALATDGLITLTRYGALPLSAATSPSLAPNPAE